MIIHSEMRKELVLNGWQTLWSEDNWIKKDFKYSNPDMAGLSTIDAYEEMKKELLQKNFDPNQD